MTLTLRPLKQDNLDAFRRLLGSSEFGGCFCAVWTSHGDDWGKRCQDPLQPNFTITQANVAQGKHVGYLVYQGEQLVAWTGSGPKAAFPFLSVKLGSRLSDCSETTWSIGCLAVAKEFRGKGLADAIVRATIEVAQRNGARTLESYPVRPFDESRVFRGTESLYRRLGFTEIASDRDSNHEILLMKLDLGGES